MKHCLKASACFVICLILVTHDPFRRSKYNETFKQNKIKQKLLICFEIWLQTKQWRRQTINCILYSSLLIGRNLREEARVQRQTPLFSGLLQIWSWWIKLSCYKYLFCCFQCWLQVVVASLRKFYNKVWPWTRKMNTKLS